MNTIPDSNVLLDVFQSDPVWALWSARHLGESRDAGRIVVNPVIYAESGGHFIDLGEFQRAMSLVGVGYEDVPWRAAFLAGRTFRAYRKSGGMRERVLPDFLIGAHAATLGYRLLTRDAARYRTYFPKLHIIAPDTHP